MLIQLHKCEKCGSQYGCQTVGRISALTHCDTCLFKTICSKEGLAIVIKGLCKKCEEESNAEKRICCGKCGKR